jgi:hypothetical protein
MTMTMFKTTDVATATVKRPDEYKVVASDRGLGYNQPQVAGRKLWLPMFLMAPMGFAIALILGFVEADTSRTNVADLQTLRHLVPAFMWIGFLGVFSAITFTVARILGAFRKGGGEVQEASGDDVQTLKMPATAKGMLLFMMMGMMSVIAGIVGHFIGAGLDPGLGDQQNFIVSTGFRRVGVAMYLTGIALGLSTIITVLRFQATRIREVADNHGHQH